MKVQNAGQLLFPAVAIVYAAYMILEQVLGGYRGSTVLYASLVGGAVILLSLVVFAQAFRGGEKGSEEEVGRDEGQELEDAAVRRRRLIKLYSIFFLSVLLVVFFQQIGYLVGVAAFVAIALMILAVRSAVLIVAITGLTTAAVHFVFVEWFGLPLPAGFLQGII